MKSNSKKSIAWTVVLVLFLGAAIYMRFQWLSLLIPGVLLMWYGLIKASPSPGIDLQKLNRSGLH